MWFLDHAWLIPAVPAVSFVVILLFGPRLPRKGSEVGILAVLTSFALSIGVLVQWIDRVTSAGEGGEHALRSLLGSGAAEEEGHAAVEPIIHTVTWFQNGGVEFTAGTL